MIEFSAYQEVFGKLSTLGLNVSCLSTGYPGEAQTGDMNV